MYGRYGLFNDLERDGLHIGLHLRRRNLRGDRCHDDQRSRLHLLHERDELLDELERDGVYHRQQLCCWDVRLDGCDGVQQSSLHGVHEWYGLLDELERDGVYCDLHVRGRDLCVDHGHVDLQSGVFVMYEWDELYRDPKCDGLCCGIVRLHFGDVSVDRPDGVERSRVHDLEHLRCRDVCGDGWYDHERSSVYLLHAWHELLHDVEFNDLRGRK